MTKYRSILVGFALLCGVAISGAGFVTAQEAPAADHPAHIHEGECGPGLNPSPKEPLENIVPRQPAEGEEEAEPLGVLTAPTVLYSETEVELNLDDILANSHAINVHESQENAQNYIACGNIGGIEVDDQLSIGLFPESDSGYTGVAILERNDDQTTVKVYLVEPAEAEAATPAT
jgi:hypothetical protein